MVRMTSTSRWSSTRKRIGPAPAAATSGAGAPGASHAWAPAFVALLPSASMSEGSVWLERRVIAYAHQGGAWESPSSTLHAIRHALDAGAPAIELDVHATADGELVVCHDATVDRTTDRSGTIASFTLEELRQMDFSYWWIPGADVTPGRPPDEYPLRGRAPADRSFGIATLREVLEQFPGVVFNLDIKQTAPVVAPYEATLAQVLRECGRSDDIIVASFLDAATDA